MVEINGETIVCDREARKMLRRNERLTWIVIGLTLLIAVETAFLIYLTLF